MLATLCAMKLLSVEAGPANMLQMVRPEVRDDDLMSALEQDSRLERRIARITLS